ncbi:MAG: PKD domain-containing protein [Bacteroidales bacterium]|nr:PKD domain-containing protein [Bacteroidales bacterium]
MYRKLLVKSIFGLIVLLSLTLFGNSVSAQMSYGGKPWTFSTEKGGQASFINVEYDEITLKAPNVEPLIAEDSVNASKDKIPRIGVDIDVDISMETAGTWTELPMGARLWTLKISVPGAKALNLGFENFHLAEGSKLFCYNENRRQVIGAFTSENNPKDGIFGIEVIQGENLYVEYYEPAYKKSGNVDKTTFHIFSVGYFYRDLPHLRYYEDMHTKSTGWQSSGNCEVDINCTPVGDNWQDEKRGVVEIYLRTPDGWGWCSGSLVNNTNNDGTPYILTAFHCGEGEVTATQYSQWQFYFKYEVPANQASGSGTSSNISEPAYKTLTGCTEIASGSITGGSDLLLLRLNTTPNSTYEPYYNGWNRANTAPSNGVGIHHPAGDVKKISTYSTSSQGTYNNAASNAHWRLRWTQNSNGYGVTEGGSSGSPLFDNQGFIVGTLTGGSSYCTAQTGYDYYGKFYYHWESNGTADNKRLKPWLDPTNSGVTTCPAYDPYANQPPEPDFAASSTTIVEGGSVDFYNYTGNNPESYSWSFPGGTPSTSTEQEPTGITYNTAGTYNVSLSSTNAYGTNTETKNGYITVLAATGTYCDTISQFGGEAAVYSLTNNNAYAGYLSGTNSYEMTSWAEKFTAYSPYNKVSGFRFFPAVANNGTNCNVTFNLWSVANGAPSEVIASKTISMANVISAMNSDGYIDVDFGATYDIPAEGFAVGFDRPGTPSSGDTLATYSNSEDGEFSTAYVDFGGWVEYASLFGTTGLQYPMFPFVCYDGSVAPTANFTSDTRQIEVGESVSFYDISAGNVTSRTWTFEGGSPSTSTAVNPVVTYSAPGSYQVSLTVSNATGSDTRTIASYINVFDPNASSASFSLDFEACGDFQVDNFHPWTTYDGDGAATYASQNFDFLNEAYTGSFIAFNSSATSPEASGWEAHGGDRCGICFASTTPPNNDWLISAPLTLCSNASISFWAKSITDSYGLERFNVLLSTTDNSTSSFTVKLSGNNYIEAPTTWTQYTYSLSAYAGRTVYVAIQCVSNDAYAFMIDDIEITGDCNSAPTADFMADVTSIDRGETVSFTDRSTQMPTSWSWTFDGGTPSTSTAQNPRVTYNTAGTYSVSLTVTNAQGTDTETKTGYITVSPYNVIVKWDFPSSSADATADGGIEANLSKELTVGGGVGTITYTTAGASTMCASATTWMSGSGSKYWTVNFTTTGFETIKLWSKQSGNNNRSPRDFKVQYSLNGSTWTDVSGTNVTVARNWTSGVLDEISLPTACNNQGTVYLRWIMRSNTGIGGNTVNANTYASYIDDIIVKGVPMITTPEAAFTANVTSICPGATVTFTDQTTNDPTSWSWNFGDGGTSTAQNPTHTYETAGTYTVTLVAGNANGTDTETKTNYITVNAAPTVTASNDGPYCVGGTAALSANVSGATTYAWSGPSSYTASTQNASVANLTTNNAGTYTILVTSAASCTATASTTLTVNASPTLTVSNNGPYCEGATIRLTATGNGGTSYSWSGPDGFASTQRNPSIANATTSKAGTYTATLTNTTTGCSTTATTNVVVNTLPTLSPSNNGPYCVGETITLNANGSGGTYAWSGPNGYTSSAINPSIANAATTSAGTYNVTLTNAAGCSAEANTVVVVNANPTVSASNTGAYCAGQTISLSATSNATSFAWSGPNGYSSAEQNPTIANIATTNGGTYTVVATNANNCTAQASTVVTVNANPTANASNTGAYCEGQTITLQTTSTGSYAWSGPNGFTSNLQNPTIANSAALNAGTYTLVVTNANNCSATASTDVVVNATPTVTASNTGAYCAGHTISLSAVSDATSFAWSGPSGFTSAEQNPTIEHATTNNGGTYTVVVTSASGCTAEASTVVVVNANSAATASNTGAYCEGQTIALQTTSTGSYAWSGPNGFTSTLQNPTIDNATTANAGIYTLVVTNANGCITEASTEVVVNTNPTLTASNTGAYCAGETISLSAASDATSFAWSGPNGFTSTLQNPTIENAATTNAGTYTVVATSANGCYVNASTNVVVNAAPTANASNTGAYCEGQTIALQTTSTGSYAWSGPNGFTSTEQNPTIANATTENAGTYTLVVTSANGCDAEATTTVVVNATPTLTASNTGAYCVGETISLSAASDAASYVWNGPNGFTSTVQNPTIENATNTNAGTYTVVATSANGCTANANTVVVVNTNPTANASNTGAYCEGQTITLQTTATGTYAWSGPNGFTSTLQNPTIENATLANAGTYTLVVSNANGCNAEASTIVVVNANPTVELGANVTVCSGASTVLDAGAGLTYHWSTGATTQTISAVAGDYYVTVYNANECSATDNISVANHPQTTLAVTSTAESHNNAIDGTATVTPTGTSPFQYIWSNNGTTATISGLTGGNYSVTVTDGNGCESTAMVNVATSNTPPVADFSVNNAVVCLGTEVAFTDLSTNTPTSWTWNFGDGETSNVQNPTHTYASAGSYTVSLIVSNVDGSDIKEYANMVVVNAVPTANATNTGEYCAGETIELSVESDIATEFQWVGPMGFSSALQNPTRTNATANHAGTYTVTATTVAGCSAVSTTNVIVNVNPTADASTGASYCEGQTIELQTTAVGNYAWSGPNGFTSILQNPTIENATTANEGTYTLVVTNEYNCTAEASAVVVVNANPTLTVSNDAAYCAGATVSLTATSDAASFVWNGPNGYTSTLQNPTIANAAPANSGTYTVVATSANGCIANASVEVTVNATPTANASNTGDYCEGQAIELQTTAVGNYEWSGPNGFTSTEQNPTIANATTANEGTYTLVVTNEYNCSAEASTIVVVNATPTLTVSDDAAYCAGETVSMTATSNAASFVWNGPNGYISALQNPTISNATPANSGTYTVVATSANGCGVQASVNVTVSANPVAYITNNSGTTTLTCSMSSIQLVANGGTSYSWNNGIATTAEYNVTAAGEYTVLVTNDGNCTAETSIVITEDADHPTVTVEGDVAYCEGETISLTAVSNVPATYSWSGPNGFTSSSASITLPNATTNYNGAFVVTATPANGCAVNTTANVVVYANPSVAISNNGPACEGEQVTFTASSNETLSYSWSGPNGFTSTVASPVISAATLDNAGTYTLDVENTATGCVNTFHTELIVNANPVVDLGNDIAVCANVTATLNATPGFVSYTWNGEVGLQSYVANEDGEYTVVVTDNHGCTASDMVSVTHYELPVLSFTSTAETGTGQADGTAAVEISGGAAPYAIHWNTNATTAQLSGLATGQYTVIVTDNNGCEASGSVNVGLTQTPPVAAFTASVTSGCAPLTVNFTDESTNYPQSWTWYFGATTSNEQNPTFEFTEPGTYPVLLMVSNPDGTNVASTTITVYANPTIELGEYPAACEGTSITVSATGFASYEWSNGSEESSIDVTEAGTYTVVVTDAHGCTATDDVAIAFNPLPVIELGDDVNVCSNAQTEINAGLGFASYAWSNGDATQSILVSEAGEYTVTVTDEFGCAASDAVNVTVLQAPTFVFTDTTVCNNSEIIFTINTDDEVLWFSSIEGNTYTETYQYAGDYLLWVTVANENCETTDTITVTVENCTSIDEFTAMEIQLYPNPVRDEANFTVTGYEGMVTYSVVDLSGREMTFETISVDNESVHSVDVSNLVPGMYILRVTTGSEVHNLKFTKE